MSLLRRGIVTAFFAIFSVQGCAPAGISPDPQPDATAEDTVAETTTLAASVQAESHGDSARFILQVTNASERPVQLTFSSGQSFDFIVLREEREVWRWSNDQMFTQAIREETLAPGETRSYDAIWNPPAGTRGEFTVRGLLTVQEHRVEQQTGFRLP
ncbi:hypothetical protein BH23GEM3_BH23GEM3_17410 [soil metagenome]